MAVITWGLWAAGAAVVAGQYVEPSPSTGFLYRAAGAGTSALAPPTWPTTLEQTVLDNTVTWTCWQLAPYIDQADLEDRLTKTTATQLFDDNNDGVADVRAVNRLRFDASSYTMGLIGGEYSLTTFPKGSALPNELVRIPLDVAEAMLAIRHPELVRKDGEKMLARVRLELKELKAGVSRVDITPGTSVAVTPANVGGILTDNSSRMIIDGADGRNNNGLL